MICTEDAGILEGELGEGDEEHGGDVEGGDGAAGNTRVRLEEFTVTKVHMI